MSSFKITRATEDGGALLAQASVEVNTALDVPGKSSLITTAGSTSSDASEVAVTGRGRARRT
jgi:hypothetical protein